MGGHPKCDCNDLKKAEESLRKPGFDVNLFARGAFLSILTLGLAKTVVPGLLTRIPGGAAVLPAIPTLSMCIVITIIVVVTRGMLVGTCCLPARQLSAADISRLIETRDADMEARITNKRNAMAARLSRALQFKTISFEDSDLENKTDYNEFTRLHAYLAEAFPRVHAAMERHVINNYSLVFKWPGSDPAQKPYLLTAHMDVVPASEPEKWEVDPFAGIIRDGFVWGRGAIDDKQGVLGWLEAAEELLESGFAPKRTIYFAFGHDEEKSGLQGAVHISRWLAENVGPRDIFEFMMDEGLFIIDGAVPGHKKPVAFVCVAEKGYLSLKLTVDKEPGHSSAPGPESAIGILAAAVKKIEDHPHPTHFDGPAHDLFGSLREGFSGIFRFIFSNLWLFEPVLKRVLVRKSQTATMVRTTSALTIFKAGSKDNVIPSVATAVVNHRIHPSDTIESVTNWDKSVVNDPRVQFEVLGHSIAPAPVSAPTHPAFGVIRDSIHRVFKGNCAVAPGLFVAASDSKHYWNLTPQIFRFNPICLRADEVGMFHGFNEKISIDNYAELVSFCTNVITGNDARYVSGNAEDEQQASAMQDAKDIATGKPKKASAAAAAGACGDSKCVDAHDHGANKTKASAKGKKSD